MLGVFLLFIIGLRTLLLYLTGIIISLHACQRNLPNDLYDSIINIVGQTVLIQNNFSVTQ